jgi:tRNA-dihydrouridine synthase A
LHYDRVWRLKQDFPALAFVVNGGLATLDQVEDQLGPIDGAMLGRAAYHDPWILADADRRLFGLDRHPGTRHALVRRMLPFIETQLSQGVRLHSITRHMLGLFQGQPGARHWRRLLSDQGNRPGAGTDLLLRALPPEPVDPR